MDKYLNIISLNIPWPANYGGVLDIYYKMKALHECGVKIILHCFEYERPRTSELEKICHEVHYYKRRTGLLPNLTYLPYNVYGRKDKNLIKNLLKNDYPILFEGLHSCYYLSDKRLRNRFKIFRECNIEHDYYNALSHSTDNIIKKSFFKLEGLRFRLFQKNVKWADLIISVSTTDADYLRKVFPEKKVEFIPCFHANEKITTLTGKSNYILYHGKLSVPENEKAVLFLIKNVFCKLKHKCIVAGMDPSDDIYKAASYYNNIEIIPNPEQNKMEELISKAQIHTLVTFQDTGLKLKLLNRLFGGRHTLVNSLMLAGSGLDSLCRIANTPEEMVSECNRLMEIPVDEKTIAQREKLLFPAFSNKEQAKKLIKMIYGE